MACENCPHKGIGRPAVVCALTPATGQRVSYACGNMRLTSLLALLLVALVCARARAWDGYGHRMITRMALTNLDADMPAWLKDEQTVTAAADLSQQPDRWRGVRVAQLTHLNNPDHYIDVEDLGQLGMSLKALPPLRHEYARAIERARSAPGFKPDPLLPPENPARDFAKTDEYPGFLPHATLEAYGKVVSAFKMVRTVEGMKDPSRAAQVEAAQWNARVHIGFLSHYVGDAAQPLHTTRHHHGWVGPNPEGYTTDKNIHRYIDGDILRIHHVDDALVGPACDWSRKLESSGLWDQAIAHIERSHAQMEPLYKFEKAGQLTQDVGRDFIVERLADAASQLSALLECAWREAAPSPQETQDLIRFEGEKGPGATPAQGTPGTK